MNEYFSGKFFDIGDIIKDGKQYKIIIGERHSGGMLLNNNIKFILMNTGCWCENKYLALDEKYIQTLKNLKISYTLVDNKKYTCIIDIKLNELLLLQQKVGELIIAKTYDDNDTDGYPILEIYDDWRE